MRRSTSTARARPAIAVLFAALFAAMEGAPLEAQTAGTDNRDGSYVNLEEAPVHPLELVAGANELWLANVAAGTVSVFQTPALTLLAEIPVGLGPVTIRQRPDSNEMWVACQSSGSLFIIDRTTRRIVDSVMPGAPVNGVEIGSEPCGLIFDPSGAKAYCTLSVVNQIAEIDAAQRTVIRRIEFGTIFPYANSPLVHAEEPRALLLDGSTLYALSLESGNGSTASAGLSASTMLDMWALMPASGVPPPDRDLLSFDLSTSNPVGQTALWRMGTLDFDAKIRPGSSPNDFWVSNTDAHNLLLGEFQFPLNGIATHRVSHAVVNSSTIPQPTVHIDLNDAASHDPNLPASAKFGVPNEMAFTSDGSRLFVCCYETRDTAVIDAASNKVIASLASGGYGPRGLALDAANGRLYVYNRADATVDAFDTSLVVAGAIVAPAVTTSAGFDPTPGPVRAGRLQHINAANSSNGVQSCNTCHLDGHNDRIAWDLGSFSGSLPNFPVPKDAKGIKVTQSLRNIEETAPYHWRGDRADLDAFNPAFQALLGGASLSNANFSTFQSFIFSIAMPPNPRQLPDRTLSATAVVGQGKFTTIPVLRVSNDTVPPLTDLTLKCIDCHRLDNYSGTTGQIFNDRTLPLFADNPAHLRGLFDKNADDANYGSAFTSLGYGPLNRTVATGWGTGNTGFGDSVEDFVPSVFGLNQQDASDITQFVVEFDSGLAPATSYSFTLTPQKAATLPSTPVQTYLMPQAGSGNCDLAVRGALASGMAVGMLYDPGSGLFVSDHASLGSFTYAQVVQLALAGGTFSFVGVPFGSGRRVGIDRDLDFLSDGDEITTSPTNADSDGDGFSDGYEVAHGSNPADPNSVPVNGVAPTIVNAQLVFSSSVVAKFRWDTTAEASARITVADAVTGLTIGTFVDRRQERHHVMVARKLEPNRSYVATIDGFDGNLNAVPAVTANFTTQSHVFQSVHSRSVTLTQTGVNPNQTVDLLATIIVEGEDHAPIQNAKVIGRFVEWRPNVPAIVTSVTSPATDATGKTSLSYTSSSVIGANATVEFVVDDITDTANELHFHPLEVTFSAKTSF